MKQQSRENPEIEQVLKESQPTLVPFLMLVNAFFLVIILIGILQSGNANTGFQYLFVSGAILLVYGAVGSVWILKRAAQKIRVSRSSLSPLSIDEKVKRLGELLLESTREIEKVENDLNQLADLTSQVERRVEELNPTMPKDHVTTIVKIIQEIFPNKEDAKEASRRDRLFNVFLSFFFLFLGAIVSLLITQAFQ